MNLWVRFDAEIVLADSEVPETLDYASVQRAVQDTVEVAGVVVIDVTEYEEQTSRLDFNDGRAELEAKLKELLDRPHAEHFGPFCPVCGLLTATQAFVKAWRPS